MRIDLITILADEPEALAAFYRDVLGFPVAADHGGYVEFESPGVRFAVCDRRIMGQATNHPSFSAARRGQSFELAFPADSPEEVDDLYARIVAAGATPVQAPADQPWGQHTAFFADPEGNIHELFAPLPQDAQGGEA